MLIGVRDVILLALKTGKEHPTKAGALLWTECLSLPKPLKTFTASHFSPFDGTEEGLWEVIRIRQSWGWSMYEWNQSPCKSYESLLPLSALPPPPKNTRSRQLVTRKRSPTRTQPCWHLNLDLLASRTVVLLFISHPISRIFVLVACTKIGF